MACSAPTQELFFFPRVISCILATRYMPMRTVFLLLVSAFCLAQLSIAQVDPRWKPNDPDRPVPPVIEPGTPSTLDAPGHPPSDAVVLFDGKDLSQWAGEDGQPSKWKVTDGAMEVVPHTKSIHTRQPFGDSP